MPGEPEVVIGKVVTSRGEVRVISVRKKEKSKSISPKKDDKIPVDSFRGRFISHIVRNI